MVFLHADVATGLSKTKKVVHARERDSLKAAASSSLVPDQSSPRSKSSTPSIIGTPMEEYRHIGYKTSPTSSLPNTTKSLMRFSPPEPTYLLSPQMDNSPVMTQQYISHWISILQAEGLPWMSRLESLLTRASNPSSFAIGRCVLAVALGYHGKLVNSRSVMVEAYKWYGFAIRKQRTQLEHFHSEMMSPSLEQICLPIMLTIFEIICGTNLTPYSQHVMGAARMLEVLGPAACRAKQMSLIFKTVRTQMVVAVRVCLDRMLT
jgi:hypothetical protein